MGAWGDVLHFSMGAWGRTVKSNGDFAMNTTDSPNQFHTLPGTGYVREGHPADDIERAKRYVAEAREAVERQERLVEISQKFGQDTRLDEVLLQLFRRSLANCKDSLAAIMAGGNLSDHKENPNDG